MTRHHSHCASSSLEAEAATWQEGRRRTLSPLLAAAAASFIVNLSGPAFADIQTVAPGEAVQRAQPIPQQTVNKRTVWLLFGGGAAAIYGSALLLERNRKFFPAIYKANETMRRAKEQSKGRALAEKAVLDLEQQDESRLQRSVEAGLADAQSRMLPDASPSTQQGSQQSNESTTASSSSQAADSSSSQSTSSEGSDTIQGTVNSSADYGKGSTLSPDEKQKAAVSSVK